MLYGMRVGIGMENVCLYVFVDLCKICIKFVNWFVRFFIGVFEDM